jgi:hypothetical protein
LVFSMRLISKEVVTSVHETYLFPLYYKANNLLLFRKIINIYCKNHTEPIIALCKQKAVIVNIKTYGVFSYLCT